MGMPSRRSQVGSVLAWNHGSNPRLQQIFGKKTLSINNIAVKSFSKLCRSELTLKCSSLPHVYKINTRNIDYMHSCQI